MSTEKKAEKAPSAGVGMMPLLIIVMGGMLGSGGLSWFLSQRAGHAPAAAAEGEEKGKHAKSDKPAEYVDMGPAFIIALADEGKSRYLQLEMQLMAREHKTLGAVEKHMPRIRNNLLLRLGQESTESLRTREDKERIQAAVLEEVNTILHEEDDSLTVDAVLFTSFVTQ
jgi:flagellar protein FliL